MNKADAIAPSAMSNKYVEGQPNEQCNVIFFF